MPEHMRAWQCSGPGPVAKTLKLVENVPHPTKPLKNGEILVEIARAAINPLDYKVLELGMAARAVTRFPKTPGIDFSGRVVDVAPDADDVRPGDSVLGRILIGGKEGSLSQFAVARRDSYVTIPAGLDLDQAAGAPTAGLTAYKTIAPHVTPGNSVFINGGSGGVGLFGIQVAKALGCRVTVSCSTAKAALCREMGADDIIDYKTGDVINELKQKGQVHALIVDNVSTSPPNLYAMSHHFLVPRGKYVFVGGAVSASSAASLLPSLALPSFLGGGKRKFVAFNVYPDRPGLEQIAKWLAEGKLRTVIDSVYEFGDADKAFEHLKKGSSGGKIIVRVAEGK